MKLNNKAKTDLKLVISKFGLEADLIDIDAIWDSTLTYLENKTILEKFLSENYGKTAEEKVNETTQKDIKEQEEVAHRQMVEAEEEQVKLELTKAIEQIKITNTPNIDDYFKFLNQYVDILVKASKVFGLIIEGDAGLGKSYNVLKRLEMSNLEHDKDYVLLNSHISPMEMYEFFWKNSSKIIVLDDISNLFEDETKVNLLMSALWSPLNKRIMNWQSSTSKIEAPHQFEFSGKVIILTNRVPNSLETLKSRCFHYELSFTYEDKIKLLYEIGNTAKVPINVIDFIHENSSQATNLNFRTLFKINEMSKSKDWEKLALQELQADEDRSIFLNVVKIKSDRNEQIKEFTKLTGLSRRTFYRMMKSCAVVPSNLTYNLAQNVGDLNEK